ncbi:MAG: hypothetical protein M3O22_06365 [Pseudomonadota bacterium]|nr:hypothetical protein [Pseudomonadota bacterium]
MTKVRTLALALGAVLAGCEIPDSPSPPPGPGPSLPSPPSSPPPPFLQQCRDAEAALQAFLRTTACPGVFVVQQFVPKPGGGRETDYYLQPVKQSWEVRRNDGPWNPDDSRNCTPGTALLVRHLGPGQVKIMESGPDYPHLSVGQTPAFTSSRGMGIGKAAETGYLCNFLP